MQPYQFLVSFLGGQEKLLQPVPRMAKHKNTKFLLPVAYTLQSYAAAVWFRNQVCQNAYV